MSHTAGNSDAPANPHRGRGKGRRRRPKTNHVNMPSGTKVSIVIPSRSTCNCTTVGANLKMIELKAEGKMSGREYKIVAHEMHTTLRMHNFKSYNIQSIYKIQNCCLWAKFRAKEKQIAKECGYVNERMLFHGSPAADIIAKTGFDINQAKAGGCFGRGCYFAPHSSKSNHHAGGLGHRKMLFCRVALGRMHSIPAEDRMLTQPPPHHHSVEGQVAEPEIIVYDDAQAYPEFLVNYDIQN